MRINLRAFGILAAMSCLGFSAAFAADGSWKFQTEDRGHPELIYSENNKSIFMVGCGHAFAIHAVYPGEPKKDGEKATLTVANAKREMKFEGQIDSSYDDDPPNTTHFVQWDLGYERQNPGLYGKKWKENESRLFDFLDSGQPLTVSAEGRSYVLPPIKIRDWKLRFKKIC